MKNYFFAAIVLALTACAQQAIPAVQTQQLEQVTQHVADLAPVVVAVSPAPVAQPAPTDPPVTFGGPEQSWLEVTSYTAERPLVSDHCTASASKLDTGQVSVISVGCTGVSFGTVHIVEASGRDTPGLIGPQNLIITQRAQGVKIAEPTFKVLIESKQIWPK